MTDLTPIGQRLSQYMTHHKIGLNKLGRMTNTSGAQIHNIIKGKKYGVDKLLNIFKVFPDLNIHWLLFGIGEMLNEKLYAPLKEKLSPEQVEELIRKNDELVHEIEKLQLVNEKLEGAISYQEMTIQAYKNSIEVLTNSNEGLKDLVNQYKMNTRGGEQAMAM